MKIKIALCALLATATVCAQAQDAVKIKKPKKELINFAFGVHTGFDLGAAVPWPPGQAIGGGSKMSAVPHLTPAIGISYTTLFDRHWSLTAEATYKTVALDAKTWQSSQIFHDTDDAGNPTLLEFRGTASAKMSFTMLEIPLFVRYTFSRENNRILLGGYYSRVFSATFDTSPYKGTLTNMHTGEVEPIYPDEPYTQDFNSELDNWDAGVLIGYERRLAPRIMLSGRFMMGFKDIFKPGTGYFDYNMLHMRGTVTLSYYFFVR